MLVYQSASDSELLTYGANQEDQRDEETASVNVTHETSMVTVCLPLAVSFFTVYSYVLGAYVLFHVGDFFDAKCNTHNTLNATVYHSELVFDCSQIPTWGHIQPYLPSHATANRTVLEQHWHAVTEECHTFHARPSLQMLLSCLLCVCISSAVVLPHFRVWLDEAKSNLSRGTGQHTFYSLFNTNQSTQSFSTEHDLTGPCALQKILAWQLLACSSMTLALHVAIVYDGLLLSGEQTCKRSVDFQFCWTILQMYLAVCFLVSVVLCILAHVQHKRLHTSLARWRTCLQNQHANVEHSTNWGCLYCPMSGFLYTGELGTLQCSC
jgi:hypothetical protein